MYWQWWLWFWYLWRWAEIRISIGGWISGVRHIQDCRVPAKSRWKKRHQFQTRFGDTGLTVGWVGLSWPATEYKYKSMYKYKYKYKVLIHVEIQTNDNDVKVSTCWRWSVTGPAGRQSGAKFGWTAVHLSSQLNHHHHPHHRLHQHPFAFFLDLNSPIWGRKLVLARPGWIVPHIGAVWHITRTDQVGLRREFRCIMGEPSVGVYNIRVLLIWHWTFSDGHSVPPVGIEASVVLTLIPTFLTAHRRLVSHLFTWWWFFKMVESESEDERWKWRVKRQLKKVKVDSFRKMWK